MSVSRRAGWRVPAAILAVVLAASACGGGTTARDASPVDTAHVVMLSNAFDPSHVEVPARTTVTWTNGDQVPHNVKFDDGPASDNLSFGATFQREFDDPGTFDYVCTIHAGMVGRVTVTAR